MEILNQKFNLKNIKTICLDLDGTLYIDSKLYPDTIKTLNYLRTKYKIAFVTNTTSKTSKNLIAEIRNFGIQIEHNELFNPVKIAEIVLKKNNHTSGKLIIPDNIKNDFDWFEISETGNCLIVGDECYEKKIQDFHNFFRFLLKPDVKLYCLQKNRYYKADGEFVFDMGPVTSLLEYSCDKQAIVLGKPSKTLFETISSLYDCRLDQMIMIGDDTEFDVIKVKELGLFGIEVQTGKFIKEKSDLLCKKYGKKPDLSIKTIAELIQIL